MDKCRLVEQVLGKVVQGGTLLWQLNFVIIQLPQQGCDCCVKNGTLATQHVPARQRRQNNPDCLGWLSRFFSHFRDTGVPCAPDINMAKQPPREAKGRWRPLGVPQHRAGTMPVDHCSQ